jgi:hypothetical protein
MSVKAQERVYNSQLSGKLAIAIVAVIIVMMTGLSVAMRRHPSNAQVLGLVSMAIMLAALVLVLRYADTTYTLLLTHERLEFERRVTLLYRHIVAEIPVASIIGVWEKARFDRQDQVDGKTTRYTVSPRELTKFPSYVLLYHKDGQTCCIHFQCSQSFYHALRKLVH